MKDIFKPIIGMIHLAPLPGSTTAEDDLDTVTNRAVQEARQLTEAGFDALLLQNTGDVPAPHEGDVSTAAYMTHIAEHIRQATDLPLGINVLMNGSRTAIAVAHAVDASFVRIKVVVGAVVASTGIEVADPHAVLAFRRRIGAEHITIMADVYDRTSAPLADMPIETMADLAIRHGGADSLIITGYTLDQTIQWLQNLREALPSTRLYVGGGAKHDNVTKLLELSDGIIVGSAYKTGGHFLDPVDPEKAARFMSIVNEKRNQLGE